MRLATAQQKKDYFITTFLNYFEKIDIQNMLEAQDKISSSHTRFKEFLKSLAYGPRLIKKVLPDLANVGVTTGVTAGLGAVPGAQIIAPFAGAASGIAVDIAGDIMEILAEKLKDYIIQCIEVAADDVRKQFEESTFQKTPVQDNASNLNSDLLQRINTQQSQKIHTINVLLRTLASNNEAKYNFNKLAAMDKTTRELILHYSLEKLTQIYEQAIISSEEETLKEIAMCSVERMLTFFYYFSMPFAPAYIIAGVVLGYSGKDFFHSESLSNTSLPSDSKLHRLTVEGLLSRSPIYKNGKFYVKNKTTADKFDYFRLLYQRKNTNFRGELPKYKIRMYLGEDISDYQELALPKESFRKLCKDFKAQQLTYAIDKDTFAAYVTAVQKQSFEGMLNQFVGAIVDDMWKTILANVQEEDNTLDLDVNKHFANKKNDIGWFKQLLQDSKNASEVQTQVVGIDKKTWSTATNLKNCDFSQCIFELCDFSEVDLRSVKLQDMRFYHCNLAGVNFAGNTLSNIQFSYCNLEAVNFKKACLMRTRFYQVNMVNANLENLQNLDTPFAKQYVLLDTQAYYAKPILSRNQTVIDGLANDLKLKEQQQAMARFVIVGPAQVGKKQLVTDFCKQQAGNYQLVHWFDASSSVTLQAGIRQLANKLDINFSAKKGIWEKEWQDKISAHKRWLLVFADVVNEADIVELLPAKPNGCVIISSEKKLPISNAIHKELEYFTKEQAEEYLETYFPAIELKEALLAVACYQDTLHNEKRYYPLLLDKLSSMLKSLTTDKQRDFILAYSKLVINQPNKTQEVLLGIFYELQIERLQKHNNAWRFLNHLLYLANSPIPYSLQRKLALELNIVLDETILLLKNFQLITLDKTEHILLAPYLIDHRPKLSLEEREDFLNNLCQVLIKTASLRNFEVGANELNEIVLIHCKEVLTNMAALPKLNENISYWNMIRLTNFLAQHYTQVGKPQLAKESFEKAYSDLNSLATSNSLDIERIDKDLYNNLKSLYEYLPHALAYNLFWQGRMQFYKLSNVNKEECQRYLEQAAKLAKIIEQEDKDQRKFIVNVNIDAKGLLYILANSAKYEDKKLAIESYKNWAKRDKWINPIANKQYIFIDEHGASSEFDELFHILGCYDQIINLSIQLQDYESAKKYCDKLFVKLSQRPEAYRRVSNYINKQGKLYFSLGEFEQAGYNFQRALGYYPAIYPEYPQIDAYLGLAQVYEALKQYDKATIAIEQCIAIIQELGFVERMKDAESSKKQIEAGWQLQKMEMLRDPIQPLINQQVKEEIGKHLNNVMVEVTEIKQQQKSLKEDITALQKRHSHDMKQLFTLFKTHVANNQQEVQESQSSSDTQSISNATLH